MKTISPKKPTKAAAAALNAAKGARTRKEVKAERDAWLDKFLDDLMAEPRLPGKSLARLVIEERGSY